MLDELQEEHLLVVEELVFGEFSQNNRRNSVGRQDDERETVLLLVDSLDTLEFRDESGVFACLHFLDQNSQNLPFLSQDGVESGEDVLHDVSLSVEADDNIDQAVDIGFGVFFEELLLARLAAFVEANKVLYGLGLECGLFGGGVELVEP